MVAVFENFFWISSYKSFIEAFLINEVRFRPIGLVELLEKVANNLGWANPFAGLSLSNFYSSFLVLPNDDNLVFLFLSKELSSVVSAYFLSRL